MFGRYIALAGRQKVGLILKRGLYSGISRNPDLRQLEESDVQYFTDLLGPQRVLTPPSELVKFNKWHHEGQSKLVLFPNSTAEVSHVLKHCHARRLGVVPQGGNTGLVQGSIPLFDEVILSTSKMNKILHFDEVTGVLKCQAGCILEALDQFVEEKGFVVPLDLGAKGSCQIGGNLATNAGGIRLLRYGSLHGSVLGMDVVLADGEVLELMSSLRKDNTGYDLKQLFIGSEGTLGVITSASIHCPARSVAQNTCLLAVKDFSKALEVMQRAKNCLGEILSALEFMDHEAYHLPFAFFKELGNPLPNSSNEVILLIETSGSNDSHDKEKLSAFLEVVLRDGSVLDGVLAQDLNQVRNMWKIRECVTQSLPLRGTPDLSDECTNEHVFSLGAVYKYDLSLPLTAMFPLLENMRHRLKDLGCLVVGYGHLGDGNLHLNISTKEPMQSQAILDRIEPYVYEWTAEHQGSISAEHGLGSMKANQIRYSKSASAVKWMKKMKTLFDPQGILNPYKVLPSH